MNTLSDWLPPAVVGVTFTTIGLLKVYGFRKGIIGGGDKPMACRLFGRCPSWSKQINLIVIAVFLTADIVNLAIFLILLLKP